MMPLTCGRTSAIWKPDVRPASSVVYSTFCGVTISTATSTAVTVGAWAPVFSSLQPMRDKQPRSPANKVTPNRKGRRSCFTNI